MVPPETRSLSWQCQYIYVGWNEQCLSRSENMVDTFDPPWPFSCHSTQGVNGFLKFPDWAGSRGVEAADRAFFFFSFLFLFSSGVLRDIRDRFDHARPTFPPKRVDLRAHCPRKQAGRDVTNDEITSVCGYMDRVCIARLGGVSR